MSNEHDHRDEDGEFGAPDGEMPIDINNRISHLMQSFSHELIGAHWKIAHHAAEIDMLKSLLVEEVSKREALEAALQAEMTSGE